MSIIETAEQLKWREVPQRAIVLAAKCSENVLDIRDAISDLPQDGFMNLWKNAEENALWADFGDWSEKETIDLWKEALAPYAETIYCEAEHFPKDDEWVKIARRPPVARAFFEKRSVSPTLSGLAKGLGYRPGIIPGAPSPIISGLASGLLGAGIGYGTGWLGEKLMPDKWKKGRLSRTLAIMGGLAGAAPSAVWMANNVSQGLPFYSGEAMETPAIDTSYMGETEKTMRGMNPYPAAGKDWESKYFKQSAFGRTGYAGEFPPIDVSAFGATIWDDPRVANRLTPATKAVASGIVTGASALRGGARFVTPMDIARVAAGMGSGYVSGALVGKALGVLVGMPSATQNRLKNVGLWSGVVANLVPMLFGG